MNTHLNIYMYYMSVCVSVCTSQKDSFMSAQSTSGMWYFVVLWDVRLLSLISYFFFLECLTE